MIKDGSVILFCYLLGCINTGYYYAKLAYKQDIREIGTKVTGATNVRRLAGIKGFLVAFAGDFIKGFAAVIICRLLEVSHTAMLVGMLAVVLGHIFPVQLRFKGGKGLSTTLGAFVAYSPMAAGLGLVLSGLLFILVRQRTISALIALWILPIVLRALGQPWPFVLLIFVLDGVFLYAFRENIRNFREDWKT